MASSSSLDISTTCSLQSIICQLYEDVVSTALLQHSSEGTRETEILNIYVFICSYVTSLRSSVTVNPEHDGV